MDIITLKRFQKLKMKRRNFLAAIAALFVTPSIAKELSSKPTKWAKFARQYRPMNDNVIFVTGDSMIRGESSIGDTGLRGKQPVKPADIYQWDSSSKSLIEIK
jgi:hypothetical protein